MMLRISQEILTLAYQQGMLFQEFKKNNKFFNAVTEFDYHEF